MERIEIWKPINGYEYYMISNFGRVKSLKRTIIRKDGKPLQFEERILRGSKDTKGYIQVELKMNGKRKLMFVHRLVAEAFIDNPQNKKQVNHKDGNKLNNRVENLEWVTCSENIHHAWENGLNRPNHGERHGNAKLTEENVRYIKKYYKAHDKNYGSRALAKKFHVSTGPIDAIIGGKSWKHIQ